MTVLETTPESTKVAEVPAGRSMPVHWNWFGPGCAKEVPPLELTVKLAVKPPLKVSVSVTAEASEGPWLVTVTV